MPIILIIGALIIAGGFAALLFFTPNAENEMTSPTDSANEITVRAEDIENMNDTDPADEPEPVSSSNVEGTYEASSTYLTPARTEHRVDVTLTLKDGVVTDSIVRFDNKAEGEASNDNQARFADAYKAQVIGKSLETISLSRVGGASLTSRSFNEAVLNIATEATAQSAL